MGAFDGLVPRSYFRDYPTSSPTVVDHRTYVKNQSSFSFYKGFGLPEFEELVNAAVAANRDTVWVPGERLLDQGRTGISTWYAQALIDRMKKGLTI